MKQEHAATAAVPTGTELFDGVERYVVLTRQDRHGRKPSGTTDQGRSED